MLQNKILTVLFVFAVASGSKAQTLKLDAIIDSISTNHPIVKMYNSEIRSMDEAAKGAKNWMPTEISTGLWMVPYDPSRWKKMDDGMGGYKEGMGQYMIGGTTNVP